jgi:hypothetical protein
MLTGRPSWAGFPSSTEEEAEAYLVRLVVVLRVIFEDILLLWVVPGGNELVDAAAKLSPPLLTIDEP